MSKLKLMMGASLLIASAFAGAANAAVLPPPPTATIYAGGSTLIAPYARQAMDCYGTDVDLIFKTGSTTAPTVQDVADFNYTGLPAFNCATTHINTNVTLNYNGTGSGSGIKGVFSHDSHQFGPYAVVSGAPQYWPSVQFAYSDTALGNADVAVYNNGGTSPNTGLNVCAPGAALGSGTPACTVLNPKDSYGALVQFPVLIAPVALAYSSVYKKVRNADGSVTEYKFNIKKPNVDGSGGLPLTQAVYCSLLNGGIADWSNPVFKTLNGNLALKDPTDPTPLASWSVPVELVGRADGSGTTFILTRALTLQCAGGGVNNFSGGSSTLPSTLVGNTWDKTTPNNTATPVPGKFTLAAGSDGVAKYIDFSDDPADPNGAAVQPGPNAGDSVTRGRIGYLGADYVLPYALNSGTNTYHLNVANLQNAANAAINKLVYIEPSPAAVTAGFAGVNPPQSDATGAFVAGNPGSRANPADWVLAFDSPNPIANPSALKAYPLMGTTQFEGYSCYASQDVLTALTAVGGKTNTDSGYLYWYNTAKVTTDPKLGVLAKAGYAVMPKAWIKAETDALITGADGQGLKISLAGAGACAGKTGA